MTSIRIDLPDRLAREAEQAGLISPEAIKRLVREQLRVARVDQLFAAMDRMSQVDELGRWARVALPILQLYGVPVGRRRGEGPDCDFAFPPVCRTVTIASRRRVARIAR